ncbi:glycosyltransferase family 2 protein [Roseibacillus persicicus]|uniref:glycosyltransferase family 2 protein n=1 Tax=Roseibacillus persicicus TaxID=454148 RepID=UPI00398B06A7
MKTTVVINCYNYSQFVGEAIRSVALQSQLPDELIVVDDGSTDGSVGVIEEVLTEVGFGRLIRQKNGGQLSAFQTSVLAAKGEWLFFLDADDTFQNDHIASCLAKAEEGEFDCGWTKAKFLSEDPDENGRVFSAYRGPAGALASTQVVTFLGMGVFNVFFGNITSTLFIRREILLGLFPLPESILASWRTRADNCLIWGVSLLGGRKLATDLATVNYRVHGSNSWLSQGKEQDIGHRIRSLAFKEHFRRQLGLPSQAVLPVSQEFLKNKQPALFGKYWTATGLLMAGFEARWTVYFRLLKARLKFVLKSR